LLPEKNNLRMTRQRKIILQELRKVDTHPSADEVYELVRKQLPRISLGTIYRNLEVLLQLGEIQRIELSGSLKRYDGNPKVHYHIRCIHCERVDDVVIKPTRDLDYQIHCSTEYQVIGHRLTFLGYCRECQKKESLPFPSHTRQLQ